MNAEKLKLEDAFFPVEKRDLYMKLPGGGDSIFQGECEERVRDYRAIVDIDKHYVFSVVAPGYLLVTNQDARQLGAKCFETVFNVTDAAKMTFFNLIMPKTRSFCHIDFIHKDRSFDFTKGDTWLPYIRITNSYNRMYALHYDLGFCRGICKNGIIFGKKNIEFKFHHNKQGFDPEAKFRLSAGDLKNLEKEFLESLNNLKRYYVPPGVMWALACKVFKVAHGDNPTPRQQENLKVMRENIERLTKDYFKTLGENGYAAMNVLTDFASRPVGYITAEGRIDTLQRKAGEWVENFVSAIKADNFNFEGYLAEYADLVA